MNLLCICRVLRVRDYDYFFHFTNACRVEKYHVKLLVVGASGIPGKATFSEETETADWTDEQLLSMDKDKFMSSLRNFGMLDSVALGAEIMLSQV
jgi:hypothetical protein